jgi:hypothetical protein
MRDYEGMFVIHGDLFQFDRTLRIFTNEQNPQNKCKLEDLNLEPDGYNGLYSPIKKEMISRQHYPIGTIMDGIYEPFTVPAGMLTEEFRNSEKQILENNRNCIDRKNGVQYVSKELSNRLNGAPAEMTIDGIIYVVDLKQMEIRQKDHPEQKFSFPIKALHNSTELYYNTQTKKPVLISDRIHEYPEHVICFVFPKLNSIDPIGYCQLNGYPPTWLVSIVEWNPIHMNVPWKGLDQTRVPEMVRRNQIEQEKTGPQKHHKKNQRFN